MHAAAWVRTGDDVGGGPIDRGHLAFSDPPGELGFEDRVGAASTAAEAVVVELYEFADVRAKRCSCGVVDSLYVAKMAGVLHRYTKIEYLGIWESVGVQCQKLLLSLIHI